MGSSKSIFLRVMPFLATFAVGIFIASFFVSVTPTFKGERWRKKGHEIKRLRHENEKLRNENLRLKNELENQRMMVETPHAHHGPKGLGPEFPVEIPPPPPPAPRPGR